MDQPVAHLARYKINTPLEEMEIGQVILSFPELTGESEKDCLEMAGKENIEKETSNASCILQLFKLWLEFGQLDSQNLESIEDLISIYKC